jgi:hypothetical protein
MISNKKAVLLLMLMSLVFLSTCKDNSVQTPPAPPNTGGAQGPQLKSPLNEATVAPISPLLDWDDFTGASTYRIQVSMDANFAGTMVMDSSGVASSQVTIPSGRLLTGVFYYWRVIANISGGVSPWSVAWRFRIILDAPPPPTLLLPIDGALNQAFMPSFDWTDSPGAEFYRIQISANQTFNPVLYDANNITTSGTSCPVGFLTTGAQYYWHVYAANSNGLSVGPWSTTFGFTTADGPEPQSISGTITMTDTSLITPFMDSYKIGAYNMWPPTNVSPFNLDTVRFYRSGNVLKADYKLKNLPNGDYIMALYFDTRNGFFELPILGIYVCDTVHIQYSNCPVSPTRISIQNYNGLQDINFISWTDTTSRIY